ncbi:MAG: hypothetical protein RLZZ106_352 [Cyanobacteriota bacterium]|jgi:hypothetical protein
MATVRDVPPVVVGFSFGVCEACFNAPVFGGCL